MFTIKRFWGTYSCSYDYLQAFCDQYGTVCGGQNAKEALHFTDLDEALAAAAKANTACVDHAGIRPSNLYFVVVDVDYPAYYFDNETGTWINSLEAMAKRRKENGGL